MQVSVEKTSELSRKMTVNVPEETVQEKMEARLKSLGRNAKVDGFRPGKVPLHVVKKMYGASVRHEITEDLIQNTYYKALQDQSLKPAGYPLIDILDSEEGFNYTATFEVYPEISLAGVDKLEVVRPNATVTEADVDDIIHKLRVQQQKWHVVDRPAQDQDRVTISFTGSSEDENFTDGRVENYEVEIGSKKMIPGFEDQLVGLSVGDNKSFDLVFPENYGNEKLAGKTATFEVDVIKVEAAELPEINDEFVKAYGVAEGTVESFRNDVKENMERELEQGLRNRLKNSVMDELYAKVEITLPNSLIDEEIENLMKPYAETAKRQKKKIQDLGLPRELFEEQAKRRVALGLVLGEIIHKNEIKLDDNKVRSTLEKMAQSYEHPEEVITWYYAEEGRLNDLKGMVLEEQVVDWLLEKAKVTDETISFSDIMDKQQR